MHTSRLTPRYEANRVNNAAAKIEADSVSGQVRFLESVAKLVAANAKRLELAELEQQGANRE